MLLNDASWKFLEDITQRKSWCSSEHEKVIIELKGLLNVVEGTETTFVVQQFQFLDSLWFICIF